MKNFNLKKYLKNNKLLQEVDLNFDEPGEDETEEETEEETQEEETDEVEVEEESPEEPEEETEEERKVRLNSRGITALVLIFFK